MTAGNVKKHRFENELKEPVFVNINSALQRGKSKIGKRNARNELLA